MLDCHIAHDPVLLTFFVSKLFSNYNMKCKKIFLAYLYLNQTTFLNLTLGDSPFSVVRLQRFVKGYSVVFSTESCPVRLCLAEW